MSLVWAQRSLRGDDTVKARDLCEMPLKLAPNKHTAGLMTVQSD